MSRRSKLDPYHNLIGTVPDREIAQLAGCSIATVCHYRQRHAIPSFRSTLTEDAPPSASVAAPEAKAGRGTKPPAGSQGYAATLRTATGEQVVVLIAPDLVAAARQAAAAGEVVCLTYIGEAI